MIVHDSVGPIASSNHFVLCIEKSESCVELSTLIK